MSAKVHCIRRCWDRTSFVPRVQSPKKLRGKPMDEHQEFCTLHLPHLINYVVPVVLMENGKPQLGSGVLVGAGGRHFIATARHCIDAIGAKVWTMRSTKPLQRYPAPGTPIRKLRVLEKGWHDTLDLGYLEIADPECPELRWDQLCDSQITSGMVHFVGYPVVLADAVETVPGRLMDVSLTAATFGTGLTENSEDRMTFDYPVIGKRRDAKGEWIDSPFPETPKGFSGGACFGIVNPTSLVAHFEYKLLGIQYAWDKALRVVYATPIKRWCELLVERRLV
jgi:hypothetical protein